MLRRDLETQCLSSKEDISVLLSFIPANRLLLSIVLPSGTYENGGFEFNDDQETGHNLSIFGMFREKWCNISQ